MIANGFTDTSAFGNLDCGKFTEKKWTSNVQPRLGVVEWEKMKKQTYDLEERLLEYSVRIIKTEQLIKIFVTSISTAVKKQK